MIPSSFNSAQVKRLNVEIIKQALKATGSATKASLAAMTNLSIATCGTILNELTAGGEVFEHDAEPSGGGRPAKLYRFNADYARVLCVIVRSENGIDSLQAAVANLAGEHSDEESFIVENVLDDDFLSDWIGNKLQTLDGVRAIGIGIPGVAHEGVIGICDTEGLAGKSLGPRLQAEYGLDTTIGNDMNLTVYGMYRQQQFEEERPFAVVTFPRGHFPGAGFIAGGRILNGYTDFGGEVSYLPFAGMTRDEQLEKLRTPDGFLAIAVQTLTSIIAIFNPASIAVTGDAVDPSLEAALRAGCLRNIPEQHMPELIVQADTRLEYMSGLTASTLESLTYRLQRNDKL